MPLKVLHLMPNIERGGAERAMLAIAKHQLQQGIVSSIVVLGSKNAYREETDPLLDVYFLHFTNSYRKPWAVLRCIRRLRRLIREYQPDIVHSHLWPAARMAGWALGHSQIPHVVHVQDTMGWLQAGDRRSRMMRLLTRSALRRPNTYFVAVGQAVADYTRRCLPWLDQEMIVIHNGFDESRFTRAADGARQAGDGTKRPLVFGTAARLVPNKGIDRLLMALAQAPLSPLWELRIAGDGSERARLEDMSRSLGLTKHVRFLGTLTDMREFYLGLDAYVQPSLSLEGLPLVLTEAMACGLPVIATDVGASRELVRDGVEGLIISPDDVPALSRALGIIAADCDLRSRMGMAAAERAWSEFSSRRMAEKVVELYGKILGSPAADPQGQVAAVD